MTVLSDPHAGLCWYGMQELPALLDAFIRESTGVKEAQDIEYIHRMRVASRRLRAALPLFRPCFPEKQFLNWMKEITRVTRALGEARDADVQIAFLRKFQKKIQNNFDPGNNYPGKQSSMEPAIRFLLETLQKKRTILQKHVLSAMSGLEKSRVHEEMHRVFSTMETEFQATRKRPVLYGIPPVAALRIEKRLGTLLSYEPWVSQPDAVAEHHAMRIAAKKLRYTMEIYGPVYRNNLEKPLRRVKKLQEILGEIHDCDVWIDHITTLLLHERSLLRSKKDVKRPETTTLSSLKLLLRDREMERERRYRQFMRYWQSLARVKLWDELHSALNNGRKTRFRPPGSYHPDEAEIAVDALAALCPDVQPHSRHVTCLALKFFDELQPLHLLGEHDRFLLGCAGQLHDIGWTGGEAGHNRRGAERVFTDATLPFDLAERGILAFIILLHRGKVRSTAGPYLGLIPSTCRNKALMLAAILRVADGLDYLHTGAVDEIRCNLSTDGITCTVTGTGDFSAEIKRALNKADLLGQVTGKNLVIR